MAKKPAAINGLSAEMSAFYRSVTRRFVLSGHHLKLLRCACESYSRMQQAQELIAKDRLVVTDRHGQTRPHRAVLIEAQSRIAFARLLRELGLQERSAGRFTTAAAHWALYGEAVSDAGQTSNPGAQGATCGSRSGIP